MAVLPMNDHFIHGPVFEQGATIKKDEKTGAITIARIMKGGAADRSGELDLPTLTPSTNLVFHRRAFVEVREPGLVQQNYGYSLMGSVGTAACSLPTVAFVHFTMSLSPFAQSQ